MVHPNPTKGSFSVDLGEITCCGCRLEVVDIMGKAVLKSELNPTGKGEFSINNVTPGLYFLRIFADNQVLTEKLIKY